jgi:sulfide:quinone oxidoreductase
MKTLLILGAGTGGTIVANKMARRLDLREWKIVVVDRDQRHLYQPGLLFLPFGMCQPADMVKERRRLLSSRVDLVLGEIEAIEPEANRVKLAGRGEAMAYDQLVVALGCEIAPQETAGMTDGGWRKNIFDFYTMEGAIALRKFLQTWPGGRLVLNVAEMPIKCPVAPLEFLFLADSYFHRRGMRNKVSLTYVTPLTGAFTKPRAAVALAGLLAKKGIEVVSDFAISDVDSGKNKILSYDKKEAGYDLLVTIPVNKGADVMSRSNMGDELDYLETNKATLQSTKWPNVWGIGDATNVPTAKAGSVAHFMADALVENLAHHIRGEALPETFDGHANCYIESGFNRALLIDYSYTTQPVTGSFPLPVIGPFSLLKESMINHWGKLAFRWIYWNLLLPGRLPFPAKYSPPLGKAGEAELHHAP